MRTESFRSPVTLEGKHVRLVPLEDSYAERLAPIWANPDVNRYLIGVLPAPAGADLHRMIKLLLERQAVGTDLPFATLRATDLRPIGMTRYLHIDRPNDSVEIGGTWLDPAYWRTPFNTEAKLLMLHHAFEMEEAHRVCLQTDQRNERSQRAIERLGAVREASLRDDRKLNTGGYRSSVFFSILRPEWPVVKRSLEAKLETPYAGPVQSPPNASVSVPGPSVPSPGGGGSSELPSLSFRPPVLLTGRYVELVPLDRGQVSALAHAGRDPEVWRLLRIGPGRNLSEMTELVEQILEEQRKGAALPFAVLALPDRVPIGMFRFLDIHREDRWVETGTWLDSDYWRTPANTEVKYLGLSYAFDRERAHRVQLRTDFRNVRSQRAIERLGGVSEGMHREHIRLRDGSYRTSIVYSILEGEWPAVKRRLEENLTRPWSGTRPAAPAGATT